MRFTYQTGAQPLEGFTIQRGIHRGGFGEVYFAHSDGGKEVALKLLHQQDHEIEVRGVTQCLNLKHPNLVNLFDLKTDAQGDHWVVMEYVAGSSLEDVLASFPDGLPLSEVRDWLSGLVAGVSHLHDRGIVHRDLKPANVYRENGVVKVGDVGLSKRLGSDGRRQHTQSVGTVYYMAPEVAKGQYGPEVDVYSLGFMLSELITGKLPFTGETTAEILMKHLTAQPDLSPIPKSLRPTVARALEKDPRKRTPTARQLEQDFLRASGSSEPQTIPESAFLPRQNSTNTNGHSKNGESPWISIQVNRPLPNQTSSSEKSTIRSDSKSKGGQKGLSTFAILTILALLLFAPKAYFGSGNGLRHPWIGMSLIFAAFGFAAFQQFKFSRRDDEIAESARSSFYARMHRFRTVAMQRPLNQDKGNLATREWNQCLSELANSIGLAALVASLLSMGIYLSLEAFHRSALMPSVEHAALFTATSVVGSWLLLIGHAITANASWSKRQRWYGRLAMGAILGTCAFGLDEFLLVNIPKAAYAAKPVFESLGMRPLTVAAVEPTWLGYVCFFAGWLGMQCWSRDRNPRRTHRFSIWLTATSIVLAYAMSFVFAFPQWYAMLWAGTISTTLQLASTWAPNQPSARGG